MQGTNLIHASRKIRWMTRQLRDFLSVLLLVVSLPSFSLCRSFNGFFTPEFVRGEEPPFVLASVTATLVFGARIDGDLRFRELGGYRVEGEPA